MVNAFDFTRGADADSEALGNSSKLNDLVCWGLVLFWFFTLFLLKALDGVLVVVFDNILNNVTLLLSAKELIGCLSMVKLHVCLGP